MIQRVAYGFLKSGNRTPNVIIKQAFASRNMFATSNPAVQKPLEMVGVCTPESFEVVGSATRAEIRERNMPHRCSYCLVLDDEESRVLVQKRVAWKETYPSHFDPCPGGVMGPEESFEGNATRELEEEMGIVVGSQLSPGSLEPLLDFWFENEVARSWGRLFKVKFGGSIDDLQLQAEEVESVEWLDFEALSRLLRTGPVCPDSVVAVQRWLEEQPQQPSSEGSKIALEIKNAVASQGAEFVQKVQGSIQFKVTDPGMNFVVDLSSGSGDVYEGTLGEPSLTITIKDEHFGALYSGKLNAHNAFWTGKLKFKGDLALAMKLTDVFSAARA